MWRAPLRALVALNLSIHISYAACMMLLLKADQKLNDKALLSLKLFCY